MTGGDTTSSDTTADGVGDTSTSVTGGSEAGTTDGTGDESSSDGTEDGSEDTGDDGPGPAVCLEDEAVDVCTLDATTTPAPGEPGGAGPYAVDVQTMSNPEPSAPGMVSLFRPVGVDSPPVLFFSHAYGATVAGVYEVLLENLASHGYAVVFSPYSTLGASANEQRYTELWSGFEAAASQWADELDLTRVGFVGHSFGAGATPEMARRGFVEQGWGDAGRLMFMMAPWYSWGHDYDTIPDDTKIVMQVYADDAVNDHRIAVEDIWDELPAAAEKRWQRLSVDTCDCAMLADHVVPLARVSSPDPDFVNNGFDVWAVQRRIVALARYAFDGDEAMAAIGFGDDGDMGAWIGCDGDPVLELDSATEPLLSTCIPTDELMFPLEDRCDWADVGVDCP